MNSLLSRRPSPALLIALLALFAALGSGPGGDAVAAAKKLIGGKSIAKNAITSAKVKDGTLLAKDFKRGQLKAGKTGPAGPAGPAGPQGPKGDKGDTGAAGALAFGFVKGDGTLDAGLSKNLGGTVSRDGAFTCFYGLGFQPKNVQVTPAADAAGVTGGNATVRVTLGGSNFCDGDDQVMVAIDTDLGTPGYQDPSPFYITFN